MDDCSQACPDVPLPRLVGYDSACRPCWFLEFPQLEIVAHRTLIHVNSVVQIAVDALAVRDVSNVMCAASDHIKSV